MHVSFHELKSSVTIAACLRPLDDDETTANTVGYSRQIGCWPGRRQERSTGT